MFIKDFDNYQIFKDGSVLGPKGKFLNPWIGRGGYLKVCLKNNGRKRWVYVHRLVCENFIANPLDKKEINHKDGDKLNNNSDNLEWVTRSENGLHAFRTGLNVPAVGEKSSNHKLTSDDIVKIRSFRGIKSITKLSKEFCVSRNHIFNIQHDRYWKHLEVANV
jgi:hypothetical protein